LHQVVPFIQLLNTLLFKTIKAEPFILNDQTVEKRAALSSNPNHDVKNDYYLDIYATVTNNLQRVVSDFYSRWARKPFSDPKRLFNITETEKSSFKSELSQSGPAGGFANSVLRVLPWSITLRDRLQFFRNELDRERISIQGSNDANIFSMLGLSDSQGFRSKGSIITIHRDRLLNDSMHQLMKFNLGQWKDRIVVRYIDSFGNEEKGIDIGGLFKDFVTDLTSNTIFNASFGLFVQSDDHLLFPNPSAHILYGDGSQYELENIYRFLGRVLGKAIYENITISPQFTYFFLSFMNGKYNFMNLLSDLRTLDPDLYKNLLFLKSYDVS
jgi:hypothetical protein